MTEQEQREEIEEIINNPEITPVEDEIKQDEIKQEEIKQEEETPIKEEH